MKKVLVLEYDEHDLSNYKNNYTMCFNKRDGNSKLIKIPKTWDDLIEYCRNNKLIESVYELHENYGMVDSFLRYIEIEHMLFYEDGVVKDSSGFILSDDRTIPQMWMMIKGLTEASNVSSI